MRISFAPLRKTDGPNEYTSLVRAAIEKADERVEIKKYTLLRSPFFFLTSDVYWLNWYENLWGKTMFGAFETFVERIFHLLLMKVCHGKIISVVHNKRPHEVHLPKLNKWFSNKLFSWSDAVLVLCQDGYDVANDLAGSDISSKVYLLHHPCYNCQPKTTDYLNRDFKVLFTGLLRPYKNVELLLEMARLHPDIKFVVAGKSKSAAYTNFLKERVAKLSNVTLIVKFLSDQEMNNLMEDASLVVLPYKLASSLNSGVAMYALSKGINVLIPEIGTIKEIYTKENIFSYNYASEEEHFKVLNEKLEYAASLFKNNPDEYQQRIQTVQAEVRERFSADALAKEVHGLFCKLGLK